MGSTNDNAAADDATPAIIIMIAKAEVMSGNSGRIDRRRIL
jgi:hypothetical protein